MLDVVKTVDKTVDKKGGDGKVYNNIVAATWNTIFTSNKAKPTDCRPTSCTVH